MSRKTASTSSASPRCCVDVSPLPRRAILPPGVVEMALSTRDLWKPGQRLAVRFLEGSTRLQGRILDTAREWARYANLRLDKATRTEVAHIRITLQLGQGSWSMIGSGSLLIPQRQPSMNFGWLTPSSDETTLRSVVLHEFGHALGAIHEHQSPAANIPWDKPAVYRYYQGPPNYWTRAMVDQNLFARYSSDITNFSAFDPASIMLYSIPEEHTRGTYSVGWNTSLSPTDMSFIATKYPADDRLRQVAMEAVGIRKAALPQAAFGGLESFV
jgi:serralysin